MSCSMWPEMRAAWVPGGQLSGQLGRGEMWGLSASVASDLGDMMMTLTWEHIGHIPKYGDGPIKPPRTMKRAQCKNQHQ